MKVDSRGRISIPAWVRRNFLLREGAEVALLFDLAENVVMLVFDNGQDGVAGSTRGCESLSASSNLALGPEKQREVNYELGK